MTRSLLRHLIVLVLIGKVKYFRIFLTLITEKEHRENSKREESKYLGNRSKLYCQINFGTKIFD